MSTVAFIGAGNVGGSIADKLAKAGHKVILAARDVNSESIKSLTSKNPQINAVSPVATAIKDADVIFLATPYAANAQALTGLDLKGKVLVDCTNPVGAGLTHALESKTSGAEEVAKLAPGALVCKAFTTYGWETINSKFPSTPDMLIAGDDKGAKEKLSALVKDCGFNAVDAGPLSSSLHLEHLTLLWIKMVRMGKHPLFALKVVDVVE